MHRSRSRDPREHDAHAGDPRSRGGETRGLTCHLTTLHPERALSLALVQHLAQEMPDIEFTLDEPREVDAVWLCGYERGAARLVRGLRARHPSAVMIVTGRGPLEIWEDEVLASGADCACPWPLEVAQLRRLFRSVALERRA